MIREILCLNEECKFNYHHHCIDKVKLLVIDGNKKCFNFIPIDRTPESINDKLSEDKQTEIDLKELSQRQ